MKNVQPSEKLNIKSKIGKQAQSRLKQIERIRETRTQVPSDSRRSLGFEFLKPKRSGRVVLEAEGLEVAVPGRTLLESATCFVARDPDAPKVGAWADALVAHGARRVAR